MYELPLFKAERDAGFKSLSCRIVFASALELSDKCLMSVTAAKNVQSRALGIAGAGAKAAVDDFDLHFLKTIMVSTGWNKNDDVFDKFETWSARHTPADKPFNYEHNCADIIGHITDNHVVGEDSKVLDEASAIDDLPAKFHIVASAVLYKYWDKAELQERMDQILREIAENKWFVSMEALFKGFDYAVVAKDGTCRIIARTTDTAFLTKHLRAYGGNGTYEDMKVGRLLRNIVFSGKGLVRKPANPDSVILTQATVFQPSVGKVDQILRGNAELGYSTLVPLPSETPKESKDNMATELEILQKQLAALQTENEKLQAALAETNVKQLQSQVKTAQDEKVKADEALKQASEKVAKLEADAKVVAEEVKTLKASIEKQQTDTKVVTDELAQMKADQKQIERIAAVKSALKVNESDTEAVKAAEELAISLMDLADDKFASHIKAISKFTPAQLPPKGTPAKEPPKATNKPAPMSGKGSEEDPADVNADTKALETAEVATEPAMATSEPASAEVEKTRKSIASFFGCEQDEETEE